MVRNSIRYTIEKAKDGSSTIIVHDGARSVPLHSTYRPSEEGTVFKNRFNPDRYDTLIVIGGGLGYHLSGLAPLADRYRRIIIVEFLEGLDAEIAGNPLTSFLAACPAVVFLTGLSAAETEDALAGLIDLESSKGIQILEHPSSVRAFPEYYRAVKAAAEKIINRSAGNLITRSKLARRFFRNAVVNLGCFDIHFPFAHLTGTCKGHTALIVAAGPSLSNNLEKLKEYFKRAVIIAVDSALPVLSARGIIPDFYVSIDPQPYVFEHLNADKGTAIPLITLTAHPSAFASSPGFLSLNTHPVAQFLQEASAIEIGSFHSATGSVAGDALMAALKMGFSKIGLVGFDSSFLRFETYPRGSAYQRRWGIYSNTRFATQESQNFAYIMHASGALMHAGFYTRKSFLAYRDAIDDMLRREAKDTVYTITPPGLPLSHAPLCGFDEFMRDSTSSAPQKQKLMDSLLGSAEAISRLAPLSAVKHLLCDEVVTRIAEASFSSEKALITDAVDFFKKQNYLNC